MKISEEVSSVPDTPEYLTRWIWQHYVGIPGADQEPYDKEFLRLEERIKRLHRESFVKGLHEGKDQMAALKSIPDCDQCQAPVRNHHCFFGASGQSYRPKGEV